MKVFGESLARIKKAAAKFSRTEQGFTFVELAMVIIISLILLAGMVTMISDAFDLFNVDKDVQAVTDSSRRVIESIKRQLRTALFFVDGECDTTSTPYSTSISFYSDVDNDQGTSADVDNYANAEKVTFYLSGDDVMMSIQEPDGSPVVPATIGSYVTELRFYYFLLGETPELDPGNPNPFNPINSYTGAEKNEQIGMIRIVLKLHKGDIERERYQDVWVRVMDRT